MKSNLEARGVHAWFGKHHALENISLDFNAGTATALIGPSGCGKSTLLNLGSGLAQPSSGTVKVAGEVVNEPNKHVAFMLQKDLLVPWRTVVGNITLGASLRGGVTTPDRDDAVAMATHSLCNLDGEIWLR